MGWKRDYAEYTLNRSVYQQKGFIENRVCCPDAELASVGEENYRWIVDNMTEFILNKLKEGWETSEYRWSAMLNPPGTVQKPARKKGHNVRLLLQIFEHMKKEAV